MNKTALYDRHLQLKAKMGPFANFQMPLQYSSIKEEVAAVRNNIGIFDVSHMGEFYLTGPDSSDFINYILPNKVSPSSNHIAVYSPLCDENGKVVDDLIVYKFNNEKYLLCVNAANISKDWEHLQKHILNFNCSLYDSSSEMSLVAIQGPKAFEFVTKLCQELEFSINLPDKFQIQEVSNNKEIIISRTGYTGEDGFEIFCPHSIVPAIWDAAIKNNVTPCGLVARDVLRIEACYPLYGQEISEKFTPFDSGLKWTVKMDKEHFIGQSALREYTSPTKFIKFFIEKGIPRQNHQFVTTEGEVLGQVTSGTFSPTINRGIGMGHIKKGLSEQKIYIKVRNDLIPVEMIKSNFLKLRV